MRNITKAPFYSVSCKAIQVFFLAMLVTGELAGQGVNWQWARSANGNPVSLSFSVSNAAHATTVTADGSVYSAGAFYSRTLDFGGFTVTNGDTSSATSDGYLVKYDAAGNVLWAKSTTGSANDEIVSIVADASDDIVVTGNFSSPQLVLDADTLRNDGIANIFIAKYNSNGDLIWARCAKGSSGTVSVTSIIGDVSGNVLVTGTFDAINAIFGMDTLKSPGQDAMFVVKYDAAGNELWARKSFGSGVSMGEAVASDPSENVYVAGFTDNPKITFGLDTLRATTLDPYQIFLVKYDGAGNVLWDRLDADMNNMFQIFMKTDGAGNVYLAGTFMQIGWRSFLVFGTDSVSAIGQNVFVAKYDGSGNVAWAKQAGGNTNMTATALTVDATNNLYVAGTFGGIPVTFGGDTLRNSASILSDAFIFKFGNDGSELWATSMGGNRDDIPASMATDASGNLYVAGYFDSNSLIFGTDTLTNHDPVDSAGDTGPYFPFLAKYGHTTGIKTMDQQQSAISVYPNPVRNNSVTVSITSGSYNTIVICNVMGVDVYKTKLTAAEKSKQLELPALAPGVYYLKASGNNNCSTMPFVINH